MASPLDRIHDKLDSLLAQLASVAQRITKMETQETFNSTSLEKLEKRVESLSKKVAELELEISVADRSSVLHQSQQDKSRAKDYAEKGGLVISGGIVAKLIEVAIEALRN